MQPGLPLLYAYEDIRLYMLGHHRSHLLVDYPGDVDPEQLNHPAYYLSTGRDHNMAPKINAGEFVLVSQELHRGIPSPGHTHPTLWLVNALDTSLDCGLVIGYCDRHGPDRIITSPGAAGPVSIDPDLDLYAGTVLQVYRRLDHLDSHRAQ